jgi:hypothetical protein
MGYGITQAFAEAQDAPFKAMMSATKAALYNLMKSEGKSWGTDFSFSFPIVVIDVPLNAVSYSSETNQISTTEIQVGTMLWKHMLNERSEHGVYIVTKQAFPEFLRKCYSCAEWLTTQEGSFLESIIKEYGGE